MYGRKQTVLRWIITAIIFMACVVPASISWADDGDWTWISGSDTVLQIGTYGTQGTPSADNVPGARYGSAAWTDSTGDLWLFGGYGLDTTEIRQYLNDLWRYDLDNDTWTWMSGDNETNAPGTYGIQGTPAADNVPGARYGSVSWTDITGDMWLFGGYGLDNADIKEYLNDLWRYEPGIGQWTWISGSDTALQVGTYGTKGTPAAENVPGARYESVAWTDNSTGDLWLFGGDGLDSNGNERYMNDLWRYDPDNDTWTWMSGSDLGFESGTYGTQGMPSADNVPGARYESVAWTDNSTGDMWLFGGYGLNNDDNEYFLNDLWRYDPDDDNGTWTWMSGSKKVGKSGTYGVKGMPAADNVPGARWDSTSWMDSTGNLWLFGGYGRASSGQDFLNDLWRYDPDNDTWTWMSGSDMAEQSGIYGTKGTPAAANVPGARNGSVTWMDSTGNLLLFGGYGLDRDGTKQYLNDLWSYQVPLNMDMNIAIDTCSIKAGKSDNTDRIKFSGWMDAGDAYMIAGDEIVISLETAQVPDLSATTFSFPINADTYIDGKYKSLKVKSADKSEPVLSFVYDSAKSTMTFSAKNVDLTGLRCPITLTVQIGDYVAEEQLDEDIVNGPKKPCPLQLVMGVWDSLDVSKFKAKKGKTDDTDSFSISGTFTVNGSFDTAQPVDITLGPDTFSVPGSEFVLKKDAYSCKKVDIWNGIVTAKFDTAKCTYSIKVTKTTLNGTGNVDFSLDIFDNLLLALDPVTLPDEF